MQRRTTLQALALSTLVSLNLHPAWGQTGSAHTEPAAVRVLCSFSILQDLVQQVGGARVHVQSLVGVDADAHTFEPRPAQLKALLSAQLLVLNGLNFEPWAHKLVKAAAYQGSVLVVSDGLTARQLEPARAGHHHHGAADPHAWQDPNHVAHYVRAIEQALSRIDPAGAPHYRARTQAYLRELVALDRWIVAQFAGLKPHQRQVITSHDAFGYFAQRYQIRFLAPQGLSTEARPNARTVAQLIDQIRRENIRALFLENMSDAKLIAQIARDTGVKLGPALYVDALTPAGQGGDTYLRMMQHNVNALAQGMRAN